MSALNLTSKPQPLPKGGIRALLRSLGAPDEFGNPAPAYTGCLTIQEPNTGREGRLYLRSGRVYAFDLSGFVPPVAARLLSGGLLTGKAYRHLTTLSPSQAGPEAIAQNYCSADAVEDIHRQMLVSTLTHMYGWADGTWNWADNAETQEFVMAGLETSLLVVAADERIGQWDALSRNFPVTTKGNSVPQPGPAWASKAGESTTPEIASILAYVDGTSTVSSIASACGFTRFEIAARLAKAIADGILIIPDTEARFAAPSPDDQFDTPADIDPLKYELDDAISALEQAKATLAAAQARVDRAQEAINASSK